MTMGILKRGIGIGLVALGFSIFWTTVFNRLEISVEPLILYFSITATLSYWWGGKREQSE